MSVRTDSSLEITYELTWIDPESHRVMVLPIESRTQAVYLHGLLPDETGPELWTVRGQARWLAFVHYRT